MAFSMTCRMLASSLYAGMMAHTLLAFIGYAVYRGSVKNFRCLRDNRRLRIGLYTILFLSFPVYLPYNDAVSEDAALVVEFLEVRQAVAVHVEQPGEHARCQIRVHQHNVVRIPGWDQCSAQRSPVLERNHIACIFFHEDAVRGREGDGFRMLLACRRRDGSFPTLNVHQHLAAADRACEYAFLFWRASLHSGCITG